MADLAPDETVTRREFDRVVSEVERRLDGHDSLYGDLRDTREELVRFTEALQQARHEIVSGVTDRDLCKRDCIEHRDGFEGRLRALERFRWQFAGAVIIIAAVWTYIWEVG